MSTFTTTSFSGGISPSSKSGLASAYRFASGLDIFFDNDSVTLLPAPQLDTGNAVRGLVKWIVAANPYENTLYAVDSLGNIYRKDLNTSTWTFDRAGNIIGTGAAGQGLCVFNDYLYYATSTTIGRKGPLSLGGGYTDNFLADGVNNLDFVPTEWEQIPLGFTPQSTTVSTVIDERYFTSFVPAHDPLAFIAVYVNSVGTGNWTLTLHDSNNVVLGTATLANASVVSLQYNNFVFTTPVHLQIGNTYHFHLTTTTGNGVIQTQNLNDFTTLNFKTYISILAPDTNYHPMVQHTNGFQGTMIVGNGNYIGVFNGQVWNANEIQLEPGFNVRSFAKDSEYQVALAVRGSSIPSFEEGRGYWWDGIAQSYSVSASITGGQPNAGENYKQRIALITGYEGRLNLGTQPMALIQRGPKLSHGARIEVSPGAMDVWRNLLHIGFGLNGTDTDLIDGLKAGVYIFGNQTDRKIDYTSIATETLTGGYTISTGNTNPTQVSIGAVFAVGQDLYYSWFDSNTSSYGIDRVNYSNGPGPSGVYESLIDDRGTDEDGNLQHMPEKFKQAVELTITTSPLPPGVTVTPKYRVDRGTWVLGQNEEILTSTTIDPTGGLTGTRVKQAILKPYREIETGFVVTNNSALNTGNVFPVIISAELIMKMLSSETEE